MAQTREIDYIVNAKINKAGFNALKSEIQSLRSLSEKDLINIGSAKSFTEAQTQLKAIQASATQVEAALNKAFSVKLGTVSLSKFNNELKGLNLKAIAADFSKAGAAGTAAFNNLAASVLTTKTQIKETNKWLDDMGKTMKNTIKWGISSSAWNTMTGSFQKAYNYAKDLDRSLNNIRIVSEKSADDMARFAVQANKAAKALGSTTLDYTDASLIYYQQGLAEKEVTARTNTTVKLSNVLGISAQEVSDYMTAIWNNFDDGSKSIEYYADVITKLGAATASSAEEISTGLEKFAAIADTVGLSYEYATAALTTVTATTRQSAEVVGTAFKTLFARIQDLELGNTLDDGVTLGKYSEALQAVGINIMDATGNLRDMDDILKDMGAKWDTLSKAQQVSLAQTVAGTRQYTQLVALMDNWDKFSENLNIASNATGELNKQQDVYLESTQAHLDQLSASAERLYSNLIDSEGLNDLIDIFSGLVTGVSEYTEAIGGAGSALTQIGAILTKTFSRTISQTIATTVSNFRKMADAADDFSARPALLNQFKDIEINSGGYQNLLKMVEALHEYQDVLSEEQVQAANATIMEYNEAANRRDAWLEAKTFAEQYYQTITGGNVADLNTNFGQDQLQEYFKEMDEVLSRFQTKLGNAKKHIQDMLSGKTSDQQPLDAYVDALRENLDIIDDANLKAKAEAALDKYDKEKFAWATDNHLTAEGIEALQGFDEVFGEVADNATKNSIKVKNTFKDAMMGMEEATKTGVNESVKTWNSGIKQFDVQTFSQNIANLTSQFMMISTAVTSIGNIPNIWNNENLTGGEKVLQTIMAVVNAGNGLVQTYKMIQTVADLVTAHIATNTGAYLVNTETIDQNQEQVHQSNQLGIVEKGVLENLNKRYAENTAQIAINKEARQKQFVEQLDDIADLNEENTSIDKELREFGEKQKQKDIAKAQKKGLPGYQRNLFEEEYLIQAAQQAKNKDRTKSLNEITKEAAGLKNFGKDGEVAAEGIDKVTDALQGLGGDGGKKGLGANLLKTLKGNLTTIFTAIPPQAYIAVAAIAAVGVAIWAVHEAMVKEQKQIDGLRNASTALQEDYQELSNTISEIEASFDKYDEFASVLAGCTKGTKEWDDALQNVNESALNILNTYPQLAKIENLFVRVGGVLRVNQDVLDQELSSLKQQANLLQSASLIARAEADTRQAAKDRESLISNAAGAAYNAYGAQYRHLASMTSMGGNPGWISPMDIANSVEVVSVLSDNMEELSDLTESEFKKKLRDLGIEQEAVINSLVDYQDEIDDLADSTKDAANQMENVSKQLAGIILGDIQDKDSANTQTILAAQDVEGLSSKYTTEYLDKMTGWGISKASGGGNEIYQEILKDLKKIEGYENADKVRNGVTGDDNNRYLTFSIDGTEITRSAEEWASILGTQKATDQLNDEDYESKANEILEPIAAALDGDKQLADELIQAITSKDYSNLSQDQINIIKEAFNAGKLTNVIDPEMEKELGLTLENSFSKGVQLAINNYDPKKHEAALKAKLNTLYKNAAAGLEIDEETFAIFVDGLKATQKGAKATDEELAELAITAIKFQQGLKKLGQSLGDNKTILNKWAKSNKTAADLGLDTAEAVGELKEGLSDLLGLDVDESFLKENFDLIKKAIYGDIDALNQLEIAANKQYILNLDIDGIDEIYDEYNGLFEQLANTDLELNASFNDEQALTDLQNFFEQAKLGSAEANNILNQLGYEGELEEVKVPEQGGVCYYEPTTTVDFKTFKAPQTTSYFPEPGGKGFSKVTVPSSTYSVPVYNTTLDPVQSESTSTSYYVLKSKNGKSTHGNIQKSGLKGSLKSTGAGKARTSAIKSGIGKSAASGGGGGSSAQPKVEKRLEKDSDRYHDVDVALKHVSNSLEKASREAEKLTGKSRLDKLTQQFRLLNKEIENCYDKIDIAKGEMGELQDKLSGKGLKFNADGTIANYEDAYTAQLNYVNSIIDHYNSLSASGQEKYQDTLDKAKEDFEQFKEDISRYDELTTDVIPGIENQIQDAIDRQIELKIEAFNMEIEIRLEMSQAERDWNDFYKKVVKGIQDDDILGNFDYAIKNFSTYLDKDGNGEVVSAAAQVKKIQDEIEKMEETGSSDVYGKDKARAMQELKDAIDQSMASLTEMQELIDEIKDAYLSMMDEAKEKFNEQVSLYEQVAGLIDHDMNIISLVYGDEAYGKMAEYYKKQKENNESQLDFLSKEVAFWEKQMDSYEEGSKEWESAKEKWLEASEAWAAQTEKDIQTIRDEFLNAINVIFQELNSKMTGGMGLGYIEEQWNLINKNTDQYLDSINAIYSVQQLQNKYLESINSYDSVSAQSKLNELMEQEISYLQEQDKLSQYDIDRAELKYQIALKQIALEEAQQNKSSMRLRRDSQGNYSYQYTADNDQMSKVRQEISDLYNQLYNLDSDQYKSNLDEYYSVWVEFQEKMAEAAQINDPEMRAQQELLIREQYGELINTLTEKNELIKDNLYNSTMSHLFELYDQNSANYEMMTEEQRSILDNYFTAEAEMQNTAFNNLFGLYDQNLDAFENMTAIEEDILMNSIVPTWDSGIQHMIDTIVGEGGFEIACADAFAQLDELTKNYDTAMEARVKTYEERAEKVQEQTKELIKDNQDLIKEYETKLKYMEDEINYINGIVAAYDKATESAKNLTQAAYEYWAELKRQEAEDAKNQTVTDEKSSTGGTQKQEDPKDVVKNTNTNTNSLGYASNGAPFIDTYTVKRGDNLSKIAAKYGISWKRIYTENKSVIGSNANLIYPGQKFKIPKYLSGGYTGDWAGNGGQLAMLHKKELVLNARDTENMLNAIEILRNITNGLNATMLNRLAGASANGFGGLLGDGITQNVHISAEFPNATSSREIEDALNNLVNRASQEIHKK